MNPIAIIELVGEIISVIQEMKQAGLFDDAIKFVQGSPKAQDLLSQAQTVIANIPVKKS
jgi:hypothetical protein